MERGAAKPKPILLALNQIRKVLTLVILNTVSTEKSGITPFPKNRLHMSLVLSGRKEPLSQAGI